jgi:hypothetical protein
VFLVRAALSLAAAARFTVVLADAAVVFNTAVGALLVYRLAVLPGSAALSTLPALATLTALTVAALVALATTAGEGPRRRAGLAATAGSGFLAGVIQEAPSRYFLAVFVAFLAATFLAGAVLAAGAALVAATFLAGAAFLAAVFFTGLVLSEDL